MSLQTALQTSPNTAFVILEEKTGMETVLDMANRLGMRKTMASNAATGGAPDPDADTAEERQTQTEFFGPSENSAGKGSFTLGVSPTSGLELANVAATILSGGVWCPPTPLARSVTDRNGKPYHVQGRAVRAGRAGGPRQHPRGRHEQGRPGRRHRPRRRAGRRLEPAR